MTTTQAEEKEFKAQWQGNSLQILRSFDAIVNEKFGAISTLVVAFTSYARGQNQTWPFVTINDFQQRAAIALKVSNAIYTHIMPIISADTREAWEEYAIQNTTWIDEAEDYIKSNGLDDVVSTGPLNNVTRSPLLNFDCRIANRIISLDSTTAQLHPSKSLPKYYPVWQQASLYSRIVNINFVEVAGPFIEACAATRDIVLGGIEVHPPGNTSSPHPFTSVVALLLSYAAGEYKEYGGDPITSIFLPVFDSYTEDRKVLAVIYAMIDWKSYFVNILPRNVEPIVIVLANSCRGPFTSVIVGPRVEFVGAGDFNSPNMERYAEYVDLGDPLSESING